MTRRSTGRRVLAVGVAAVLFMLAGVNAVPSNRLVLQPAPRFKVGDAFPLMALPALEDGRARSVADFRGQKLILHVFASW